MRSPLWFVLAGVIGIAGFIAAGLHLIPGLASVENKLMQVVVPGSATLPLSEIGIYTIYLEHRSVVDGQVYTASNPGGLRIAVQAPDGAEVPMRNGGSETYKMGGREGRALMAFTISAPGAYRVTGSMPDGRNEPKLVLAVGTGMLGNMFGLVGGALAMVFGSLAIAAGIVVVTILQRSKAKRA